MKVSYDGSGFYGFQRLNDYRTVQKVLEEALGVINKGEVLPEAKKTVPSKEDK